MLALLAIPVVVTVALTHRLLQIAAPSNILIARVRADRPTLLRAGGLAALGFVLIALAHGLKMAIASGAAGWLNLVAGVLLWDAIKFVLTSLLVTAGAGLAAVHRARRRISRRRAAFSLVGQDR